ncbi:P-loop containing nucleoside triphosphate hydrolase protein [Schizophyllum amplum]|uniref:P-loop containing nucleoside triphosphate hydrolase protein n=1 Tax=Schizophyllum amplum TaxID=97359 RepID=A0A550BXK1_9AGAR|nr:P-loop containing nucleoside triphosphate hydrolase protein [Auriculariopsis ampla]
MATESHRPSQSSGPSTVVDEVPPDSAPVKSKASEDAFDSDTPDSVSFFSLFRFSTTTDRILNVTGAIAAVAAGAGQPLMTLLFSRLAQDFLVFQTILGQADAGDAAASERLPQVTRQFYHSSSLNASYIVYLGIGIFVVTYFYMLSWSYTAEVNAKRLREEYLKATLRQDIAYFDNVGAGEIATRIQTDTHMVQRGISEKVALVCQYMGAFIVGFILAFIRSWRLALALSSIIPCLGLFGGILNYFTTKFVQRTTKHTADAGTVAEEVISTVRTAKAFGTQGTLAGMYGRHIELAYNEDLKNSIVQGMSSSAFFFIIYSSYGLAFSFGTTLILHGRADPGVVINVFFAIFIGAFSIALLAPEMQAISQARGAAAKLYATIDRVPSIDAYNETGLKPDIVQGDITLTDIKFAYPARPDVQVVKGVNLHFPAGKTTALVGASGSGKSTAISLVERFYDPLEGVVQLDGVNLKDLNLKWLRSQIGLVSQEPTLFATTIRQNVAHGLINTRWEHAAPEKQFELIKEACVTANADEFIAKLPEGYDTMVGERAMLLSGGQKQRIAIARAIVADPRILLLDEATSALDTQSEGIVQDALDKAATGRTTITIAHRLSTIKDADVIFVMGEGLVLEQGTHTELLQNADGPYARLVEAQNLRQAEEREVNDEEDDDVEVTESSAFEKRLSRRYSYSLRRNSMTRSLASEILEDRARIEHDDVEEHSAFSLFKRMAHINRDETMFYVFGVFAAMCSGAVYPAFGIVFSQALTGLAAEDPGEKRREGDRNALWFFIIALASTAAAGVQNYVFTSTAAALTAKLRTLCFKAILRQDVVFFDEEGNSAGSLTSSLSENAQKINGFAGITLGVIIQSMSTLVCGIAIACTPILVSTGYIALRVVGLKDQKNKKAHGESAQLACEAAGAIRTVASLTREHDCLALYSKSLEQPLKRSTRASVWDNAVYAASQASSFWIISLVFWYGAKLVAARTITVSAFFVALMSTTLGAIQAGNMFAFVSDMSGARGSAADVVELLDSQPDIDSESIEGRKIDRASTKGQIKFENVYFRYPTRPGIRVLRKFDLTIEPGTYVALVGASGSGKSTTIQLIERFYDPLHGALYFDGQHISALNITEYRKQVALVSQEPTLYSGTVRFNILLGATKPHSEVTQEEIDEACRKANILDFIGRLPNGFDTEVGGKGSQLSGGQKQRIAIARALLRNPKVLLLDEATSALDSTSEKIVQAALDEAARGRTTIAIAHRLSTIQNADKICFIKEGRVSETGTHAELVALKGDYYQYVQMQTLSAR